jgi:Right handed beta helix region
MRDLTVIPRAVVVFAVLACGGFAPAGRAALLIDVTNTNDAGPGSLRAAIATSNGSSGKDIIRFFVTGTITITSGPLPAVTDPVLIDGRTAPGYGGSPLVRIDNGTGSSVDGLAVSAGSTEMRALSITGFDNGIVLPSNSGNIVAGNWIGLDLSGAADGNQDGVRVSSKTNTIGGTTAADRNVISGNTDDGVAITGSGVTGNLVEGNYVGTDTSGAAAIGNGAQGVAVTGGATANTVGGTTTGAGNVVSGNGQNGVRIVDAGTSGNHVQGNLIGTNAAGTAAVPNDFDGVAIDLGASSNEVGSVTTSARNILSGNGQFGLSIRGTGTIGNLVEGNYIGTSADGLTALPNASSGVALLFGATTNTIGDPQTSPRVRNVISGNGLHGVQIAGVGTSGNLVVANDIGVNTAGAKLSNGGSGVSIESGASANRVGGDPETRNLISGNDRYGVEITGSGTDSNLVFGNRIGGTKAVGNALSGVLIADGASENTVGGIRFNLISGNNGLAGVEIDGAGCARSAGRFPVLALGTTANVVSGNVIGTDKSGKQALPNNNGVAILAGATGNTVSNNGILGNTNDGVLISDCNTSGNTVEGNRIGINYYKQAIPNGGNGVRITADASQNTVGGTATDSRNVISGNAKQGVAIQAASSNVVQGNYIGTDQTAASAVPNGRDGISIFSGSVANLVGGTTAAARNVISGNVGRGVTIGGDGTSDNVVQGNYVGTTADGSAALPNDTGIAVQRGASSNAIGGTQAGAGNVVSGNSFAGILLTDDGGTPPGSTSGTLIQGNLVGTDPAATGAVPNGEFGVLFTDGPKGNTLGGTQTEARNVIAFNNGIGVRVESPTAGFTTFGDSILGNAIFENAGVGISLLADGNHLQLAPVIKSVVTSGDMTTVTARLSGSAPNTSFRIELYSNPVCDPSGKGEGKDFVAARNIMTGATGAKKFAITTAALGPGLQLTETATNLANGDTSEFSACATAP